MLQSFWKIDLGIDYVTTQVGIGVKWPIVPARQG